MVLSSVLWCLFVPLVGGKPVLPEPVTMRLRMLFLKPGMNHDQVESVLRLGKRLPTCMTFSMQWSSDWYAIGTDHTLRLDYRYDCQYDIRRGKWVLAVAELRRAGQQVARVAEAGPEGGKALEGIEPALVEGASRAVQERKTQEKK